MNDQAINNLIELARVHYADDKNPWPIDAFDSHEAYRIYLAEYDKLSRSKGSRVGALKYPVSTKTAGISG